MYILNERRMIFMPYATAKLMGNLYAPNLTGIVELYPWKEGTLVRVEVSNLPMTKPPINNVPPIGPFGFHIHEGTTCGDPSFKAAGQHFNPTNKPHPFHVGDLPSLLSNDGYAFLSVFTNRFKPEDVIDRAVIIHLNPDDYRTQPDGAAGERIACGIIKRA
jgi:superoxide dismutase, Cu-Zn family